MRLGVGLWLRAGAVGWSPASLSPLFWAGSLDPASGRMWQAATGGMPVTAAEQPVGLLASSPQPPVGPNLAASPDKWVATAGWTVDPVTGTGTLVNSTGSSNTLSPFENGEFNPGLPIGAVIRVDFTIVSATGPVSVGASRLSNSGSVSTPGSYSLFLWVTNTGQGSFGFRTVATQSCVITGISVRAYDNKLAQQATALSRPTLRQSGAVWYLEDDGGDSLPAVFAAGSLYIAYITDLGAVSYTTATSDGTTGVDLLLAERMADVIVLDRAFTSDEESKIEAYWARYAA